MCVFVCYAYGRMCVCIGSTPYKGEDEVCVRACVCVFCLALGFTHYKGEDEVCMCVFCIGSTPYKGEDEVCVCVCMRVCVCVCLRVCVCVCFAWLWGLHVTKVKMRCVLRGGVIQCVHGGGGGLRRVQPPSTIHIIIKELGGIIVAGGLESTPHKGEDEVYVSLCVEERGFSVCV